MEEMAISFGQIKRSASVIEVKYMISKFSIDIKILFKTLLYAKLWVLLSLPGRFNFGFDMQLRLKHRRKALVKPVSRGLKNFFNLKSSPTTTLVLDTH